MEPCCETCGAPLPDAPLAQLIEAEELNRMAGSHIMQLLCSACYLLKSGFNDDNTGVT